MRAALDHEAQLQARVTHQRNAALKGLHAPAGFAKPLTQPPLALATAQDGRPVHDFVAARLDSKWTNHNVNYMLGCTERTQTDALSGKEQNLHSAHQ